MLFNYFKSNSTLCTVTGKSSEKVVFARASKNAANDYRFNNVFKGLLQPNTSLAIGDIINDGLNSFILTAKYSSNNNDIECRLLKCNCTVNIVKIEGVYVSGTKTGDKETSLYTSKPANQQQISANLKLIDPGLLSDTVRKFTLPVLTINLNDRIKIASECFQITAIDSVTTPGILIIQTKVDIRKTT